MKLAVIADDFTGANDVALQIRKYGLDVVSLIDEDLVTDSQVDVVSSDTRNLDKKIAKNKVEEIFLKMKETGFEKFYKKIDSTLRGNLKEEIEAILANLEQNEKLVVVPSFPSLGRTVKNGKHYLNGIPLHMSEYSRDPIHPIKTNDLKELFEIGEPVFLSDVRTNLKKKLIDIKERVIIVDAETDDDLRIISESLTELELDKYVVGSAGIMEYLMKVWGYKKDRVLIVSGSCNDKNIEQIDHFLSRSTSEVNLINLDLEDRSKNNFEDLDEDRDILIRSLSEKSEMYRLMEKGYSTDDISSYIGEFAAKVSKRYAIKKIVISGGETALKVLKSLGIKGLRVQKQVEQGIAFCSSFDGKYEIITKSGGYGSIDIFEKSRARF